VGGGAAGAAGFRESISVQIFTDPVTGAALPCEKAANQAFGRYQDVGLSVVADSSRRTWRVSHNARGYFKFRALGEHRYFKF